MGQVGGRGSARAVVVSKIEVGRTDKTKVQTDVRVDGTEIGECRTPGTGVVSEEDVDGTDDTGSDWSKSGWY